MLSSCAQRRFVYECATDFMDHAVFGRECCVTVLFCRWPFTAGRRESAYAGVGAREELMPNAVGLSAIELVWGQ